MCHEYHFGIAKLKVVDFVTDELLDCPRMFGKLQDVVVKMNVHFSNQVSTQKGICTPGVTKMINTLGIPGLGV